MIPVKKVTLAVIIRGRQVLLGRKRGNPEMGEGKLNGPGGKKEPKESLVGCLLREAKEEFGITLDLRKVKEVGIITVYAEGKKEEEYVLHVFRTETFSGEPIETESMGTPKWYDIDNLPLGQMHESDREWFVYAASGKRFRANVHNQKSKGEGFFGIDLFLSK